MTTAQAILLGTFGILVALVVASFMCVIIDRLPYALDEPNEYGESWDTRPWGEVVGGTSRCSTCGEGVRPSDNVPIVSWFLLRGRCRGCGERIPGFHPFVEAAIPIAAAAIVVANGWAWWLLPALFLVPVGVAIAVIDWRTLIVPTRLVWPSFAVSLVLSVIAVIVEGEPRWLLGGAVGLAVLAGPLFALWWVMPKGMGFGDVRLAVLLGWTLGFAVLANEAALPVVAMMCLTVMVVGSLLGIVHGVVMIGRRRQIPFGPPLVVATLLALVFVQPFVDPFL